MHPTTEHECLAFGLYTVAVRLSHTSEARKWRILLQVAGVIWEEISSLRVGVFKSPALLRNPNGSFRDTFPDSASLQNIDLVVVNHS